VRRGLFAVACLLLVPATGFIETSSGVFSSFFAFNYFYLFALGIAYLLLFTLTGSGQQSLLARVLSSRIWFPLAQLSYSAYLVHPTVLIAAYLFVVEADGGLAAHGAGRGAGAGRLCFGVAAVIYLLVERPAMNARTPIRLDRRRLRLSPGHGAQRFVDRRPPRRSRPARDAGALVPRPIRTASGRVGRRPPAAHRELPRRRPPLRFSTARPT
jgi:peptidoglycan/LPS O-acetylase OafA/YrhL